MSRDNRMVTKYGKPGSPEPEITNKFNLCGGSFSTRHICIIIKIVMTTQTCNQTRTPSHEGGENRGRIETLTAGG